MKEVMSQTDEHPVFGFSSQFASGKETKSHFKREKYYTILVSFSINYNGKYNFHHSLLSLPLETPLQHKK